MLFFPLALFLLVVCFALFWFVCCLFIFCPILLFLDVFLYSNEREKMCGGRMWIQVGGEVGRTWEELGGEI